MSDGYSVRTVALPNLWGRDRELVMYRYDDGPEPLLQLEDDGGATQLEETTGAGELYDVLVAVMSAPPPLTPAECMACAMALVALSKDPDDDEAKSAILRKLGQMAGVPSANASVGADGEESEHG